MSDALRIAYALTRRLVIGVYRGVIHIGRWIGLLLRGWSASVSREPWIGLATAVVTVAGYLLIGFSAGWEAATLIYVVALLGAVVLLPPARLAEILGVDYASSSIGVVVRTYRTARAFEREANRYLADGWTIQSVAGVPGYSDVAAAITDGSFDDLVRTTLQGQTLHRIVVTYRRVGDPDGP